MGENADIFFFAPSYFRIYTYNIGLSLNNAYTPCYISFKTYKSTYQCYSMKLVFRKLKGFIIGII